MKNIFSSVCASFARAALRGRCVCLCAALLWLCVSRSCSRSIDSNGSRAKQETRREELLVQATVEHMKNTYGKQPESGKPELSSLLKVCRCHFSKPAGIHKEACNFHPERLASALRSNQTRRKALEAQLLKTAMTAQQREWALHQFFGPSAPKVSSSTSAASSSSKVRRHQRVFPPQVCAVIARRIAQLCALSRLLSWVFGVCAVIASCIAQHRSFFFRKKNI